MPPNLSNEWGVSHIAENPYLNLFAGLLEAGETILDDIANLNLGARHGVIVFGLVHALRSVPEVMIGLRLVDDNNAKENKN